MAFKRGFAAWPKEQLAQMSSRAGKRSQESGHGHRFGKGNTESRLGGLTKWKNEAACPHLNTRPAELTMVGTKRGDKRCHDCWKVIPKAPPPRTSTTSLTPTPRSSS